MVGTTRIVAALSCCLVLWIGSSSYAGTLNLHADAIPGWTGSVAFDNGSGLKGDLDYAVFTAGDFNTNFSGMGYTPGDAVVYTYQLINSSDPGTDSISAQIVGIINAANTIGTFDIGDVDASSENFVGLNAVWLFNPEIPLGQSSWGLAFSSPNLPMNGAGLTVDGGASIFELNIPTPSDIPIPEPSSLAVLGCGGLMMLLWRIRNRDMIIG